MFITVYLRREMSLIRIFCTMFYIRTLSDTSVKILTHLATGLQTALSADSFWFLSKSLRWCMDWGCAAYLWEDKWDLIGLLVCPKCKDLLLVSRLYAVVHLPAVSPSNISISCQHSCYCGAHRCILWDVKGSILMGGRQAIYCYCAKTIQLFTKIWQTLT